MTSKPRVIAVRTAATSLAAEQDRADDAAVRDHELAVAAGGVFEGDRLLVRPAASKRPMRELDADDLEDRHRDAGA